MLIRRKSKQLDLLTGTISKKKIKIKKPKPIIVPKFQILDNGNKLIALLVGYVLPSRANVQDHWAVKMKKVKKQRNGINNILRTSGFVPILPATITLCRIAPRELDDGDNIGMAFKAMKDGITDWIGLTNDNDHRLTWKYDQQSGAARYYAVRVTVQRCPSN